MRGVSVPRHHLYCALFRPTAPMRNELRDIGEGTIRRINWQDLTPVVFLAKIPEAIGFRALYLAMIGLLLTLAAGYGLNLAFPEFQGRGAGDPRYPSSRTREAKFREPANVLPILAPAPFSESAGLRKNVEASFWQGVYVPWCLFHSAAGKIWKPDRDGNIPWVALGWFAFLLLLWGYLGTAISRIAAMYLTARENVNFSSLNLFLRQYGTSAHFAVLLPMFLILCCYGVLCFFGWMLKIWATSWVAAILFPFALLAGLLLTLLAVLLFFGWPLLIAAVAVEGSDAFDALSRMYSYMRQRPLHFVFYLGCSTLLGMLWFFVLSLILDGAALAVAGFCPPKLAAIASSGALTFFIEPEFLLDLSHAYWLVAAWLGLFHLLKVAFLFAYFWCSAVAVYLLLRKSVDGTPLDEVFRLVTEKQPLPFPVFKADEKGAPVANN